MIETKVQSAIAHSKGKSLRIIDKSNIGVKGSVILGSGSGAGAGTGAGTGTGAGDRGRDRGRGGVEKVTGRGQGQGGFRGSNCSPVF